MKSATLPLPPFLNASKGLTTAALVQAVQPLRTRHAAAPRRALRRTQRVQIDALDCRLGGMAAVPIVPAIIVIIINAKYGPRAGGGVAAIRRRAAAAGGCGVRAAVVEERLIPWVRQLQWGGRVDGSG